MKLYYTKGACSLAVRIIINEIGINVDFESVDLKAKKTESNENFLNINPKGSVPTLEIKPKEVLTEVAVILQYLADTNKATNLLAPTDNFKRYRVMEWLNYISSEIHKSFSPLFKPNVTQEMKDTVVIPNIKTKFTFLDKHLSERKYLMGDDFTLPDAYLFVMLTWAANVKLNLDEWPYLKKYFTELKKRKSIEESLKQEHPVSA